MYFSNQQSSVSSRKHCSLKPERSAEKRDVTGLLIKPRGISTPPPIYAESDTFPSESGVEDYIDPFFCPHPPEKYRVCDILAALYIKYNNCIFVLFSYYTSVAAR